ncbi:hypothetical protein [Brevundimonas sp. A19_0]|uniref:hypothetical protein n=1 Tax=Brevundimonas sp. A19_0 TaxID=2821087 RepID=UPI001ADAC5BC|nr:hypothetical protein [Brevundimonas sp. A19_0]MBO9502503.1 hypothetical protein [Brevundimonas sp. A19_0]
MTRRLLSGLRAGARLLSIEQWLWVLFFALIALVLFATYRAGRSDEAEAEAGRDRVVTTRAAEGRETAAGERAIDTRAVQSRLDERNHDAAQTPDSAPDDRDLRRRCRQLREAGTVGVPACRRFEGAGEAEARP